jgi:hypothetical protein
MKAIFKDRKYQIKSFFRYRKANDRVYIFAIHRWEMVVYLNKPKVKELEGNMGDLLTHN